MIKKILLIGSIAIFSLTTGCSTLQDARQARGQGTSKVYNAPVDKTWTTVHDVLKEVELQLAGENKEEGYILGQNGMSLFSWGENVAIFLEKSKEENKTKVEVINKRAVSTNIFATNWERKILEKLDEKIK